MKNNWTPEELDEEWTLLPDERKFLYLHALRTSHTILGLAILLKYFQWEGCFPRSKSDVPQVIVRHMAKSLGLSVDAWRQYDWQGRTIDDHRSLLREFFGFRVANEQDLEEMLTWLVEQGLEQALSDGTLFGADENPEAVKALAYARFRELHLEAPATPRIERIVHSALRQHEERFCEATLARLSKDTCDGIDFLLRKPLASQKKTESDPVETETAKATLSASDAEDDAPLFQTLKLDPGRVGLESALDEITKLNIVREVKLPKDLFQKTPMKLVSAYRQRAAVEPPRELRRHPAPTRYTLMAAYCWLREREITDNLVELLLQIIRRIGARAEKQIDQEILEDFKKVNGKTQLLYRLAEASVAHPEGIIKEILFPIVGEQTLKDLVTEYKSNGSAYRHRVHRVMHTSYAHHYRRMVPELLNVLKFQTSNVANQPLLKAIELLRQYEGSSNRYYNEGEVLPIDGVVPTQWRDIVMEPIPQAEPDQKTTYRIRQIDYEMCVLETLREKLRCKEVWVDGAYRYRNPEEDLPADYAEKREQYCQALKLPLEAKDFVAQVKEKLAQELEKLNDGMPTNPDVKISSKEGGWITVSPYKAQAEPRNLGRLKHEIGRRWGITSLLDIVKETDFRVKFTQLFRSVSSREVIDPLTLQRRLLLCVFGLGTNAGLRRVSIGDHGESYKDLLYVRRRYLNKENMRAAIAAVANAIFRVRDPNIWGEGTTACASDSKKFGAWDQNLMTEWHVRYGGRGIMIYWHVERKATCIYSQLKTCSSSEVAAMIEGVLRHCTEMSINKAYVDSHGQSEIAFAFCHLLGFGLMSRLKAIHAQKLYCPEPGGASAYPNLREVLARPINWKLIIDEYDNLVKFATALRLNTGETEAILSRFTRNSTHPTYLALAELGKAVKTIFLCQYLASVEVRQEIEEALNVIENWNSANGFIFYGKGGEMATNRLSDQELSMLALHLIQICLVYVNTIMIQRVLATPQWKNGLKPEDLRALTPLFYAHINPYGLFRLNLNERLSLEATPDEEAELGRDKVEVTDD